MNDLYLLSVVSTLAKGCDVRMKQRMSLVPHSVRLIIAKFNMVLRQFDVKIKIILKILCSRELTGAFIFVQTILLFVYIETYFTLILFEKLV